MGIREYDFADLDQRQIDQIRQLEQALQDQTGEPITLIAFAPEDEQHETTGCRALLDD